MFRIAAGPTPEVIKRMRERQKRAEIQEQLRHKIGLSKKAKTLSAFSTLTKNQGLAVEGKVLY